MDEAALRPDEHGQDAAAPGRGAAPAAPSATLTSAATEVLSATLGAATIASPFKTIGKSLESTKDVAAATIASPFKTIEKSLESTKDAAAATIASPLAIQKSLESATDAAMDSLIERQARKVVQKMSDLALSKLTPAYMPDALVAAFTRLHGLVWPTYYEPYLVDMIMRDFSQENKDMRKEALTKWIKPQKWATVLRHEEWSARLACLGRLLRAKFLYSTMPADGSIFKILRPTRPVGMLVYLAKMHSFTSVSAFALTFLLMDRTDEYQLVAFILRFKAYQFLFFGLEPAVMLATSVSTCIEEISVLNDPQACVDEASAVSPLKLCLEALRITLICATARLLYRGAYGGQAEIRALEQVRLDAYDGCLDGVKGRTAAHEVDEMWEGFDDAEYAAAVEAQRVAHGVERRSGGLLLAFLCVDAAILLLVVASYAFHIWSAGLTPSEKLFWVLIANAKMVWALLSMPFFIFLVPFAGAPLNGGPRPTGYNERGRLVPMLTPAQKRKKAAKEREEEATAWEAGGGSMGWLKQHILLGGDQAISTGHVGGQVLPFALPKTTFAPGASAAMNTAASAALSAGQAAAHMAAQATSPVVSGEQHAGESAEQEGARVVDAAASTTQAGLRGLHLSATDMV